MCGTLCLRLDESKNGMFGYDQIQFGNFGLPEEIRTIPPYTIKCGYTAEREKRGHLTIVRRTMDGKTLESHKSKAIR